MQRGGALGGREEDGGRAGAGQVTFVRVWQGQGWRARAAVGRGCCGREGHALSKLNELLQKQLQGNRGGGQRQPEVVLCGRAAGARPGAGLRSRERAGLACSAAAGTGWLAGGWVAGGRAGRRAGRRAASKRRRGGRPRRTAAAPAAPAPLPAAAPSAAAAAPPPPAPLRPRPGCAGGSASARADRRVDGVGGWRRSTAVQRAAAGGRAGGRQQQQRRRPAGAPATEAVCLQTGRTRPAAPFSFQPSTHSPSHPPALPLAHLDVWPHVFRVRHRLQEGQQLEQLLVVVVVVPGGQGSTGGGRQMGGVGQWVG